MRQGPNGRRPRGRHHGNGSNGGNGGNPNGNMGGVPGGNRPRSAASLRHQSFDSNCGDLRVRGNAWQVCEKYQALARDATSSGDRVTAENYLQHAEHYYRIIEAINEATVAEQRARGITPAFGSQQPDMPNNYYAPDGSFAPAGAPAPDGAAPEGSATMQPPAAEQGEAVVQTRTPPQAQQPSPFYTQEEIEAHNAEQSPFAATR